MPLGVNAARFLTRSPGQTALIGAGVGAAANGLRTPQEGQTRGQSMVRGALYGAGIAGGAAALGRGYRDTRLLRPELSGTQAIGGTIGRMGEGLSRFAKRQVHGLTGAYNPHAIGMQGTARAREKVDLVRRRLADEIKHAPSSQHAAITKAHQSDITGLLDEGRRGQALMDAGVTTLPGMAKSLYRKETRGRALRAMGKTVTDGPGGVAMSLGLPIALSAPGLMKGDESAEGGLNKFQKVRNLGVNLGTGIAFGGMPLIPQMAAGIGVDAGMARLTRTQRPTPVAMASRGNTTAQWGAPNAAVGGQP